MPIVALCLAMLVQGASASAPALAVARLRGGTLTPKDAYMAYAKKGALTSEMKPSKAFHSSVHTGMFVGFGGLLASVIAGTVATGANSKIVFGVIFPYTLLVILQGGGQLFTGNAGAVTAAYLEGMIPATALGRALAVSLAGNLVGTAFFAWLAKTLKIVPEEATKFAIGVATKKLGTPLGLVFAKAIFCNWLVCLAIYLAGAADGIVDKVFAFYFPVVAFVVLGLEHSIANAFMMPLGMLMGGSFSVADIVFKNLVPVVVGNAIGGAALVAASYSMQFGALGA